MHLLLTIPHEQVSRFDTDRPCKKRKEMRKMNGTGMLNAGVSTRSENLQRGRGGTVAAQ